MVEFEVSGPLLPKPGFAHEPEPGLSTFQLRNLSLGVTIYFNVIILCRY